MSLYPLDHIDHRVRALASVRRFYDALMPALGYGTTLVGATVIEYYCEATGQFFGIHQRSYHAPNETRIAFAAATRKHVDLIGAMLASIGAAAIEGPEDCPTYVQPYYAVFFEDPDGNKLEVCCRH